MSKPIVISSGVFKVVPAGTQATPTASPPVKTEPITLAPIPKESKLEVDVELLRKEIAR